MCKIEFIVFAIYAFGNASCPIPRPQIRPSIPPRPQAPLRLRVHPQKWKMGYGAELGAVSFPGKPSWGDFIVSIDNYKKRYNGMNFQLKRYFSNNGKGLRQYLGLNLYHEDETKISFKPRSLNTEKIYELEKASSLQGFSLGLNFGYKVLIHQHWLIEPQGSMRFLLLPSSSAQIGGGKAMFVLKCGYRL